MQSKPLRFDAAQEMNEVVNNVLKGLTRVVPPETQPRLPEPAPVPLRLYSLTQTPYQTGVTHPDPAVTGQSVTICEATTPDTVPEVIDVDTEA